MKSNNKQLKQAVKNIKSTTDKYINKDSWERDDFLQGKYAEHNIIFDMPSTETEVPMCVLGWLAYKKEIPFPSYIHDLTPTGYTYKGEQEVTKWTPIENEPYFKEDGTRLEKYPVQERACECELHTPQNKEGGIYYSREDWIEDDYMDNAILYEDNTDYIVPFKDAEIFDEHGFKEYEEVFLTLSIKKNNDDVTRYDNYRYNDAIEEFSNKLQKAYKVSSLLLLDLQSLSDDPTQRQLHRVLGICSKDCQTSGILTKSHIADWKNYFPRLSSPFEDCESDTKYKSHELVKSFLDMLLTNKEWVEYYNV